MSDRPKNLEVVAQGANHVLNVTFLDKAAALGGSPTNPDGFVESPDNSATIITVAVKVLNTASGLLEDPGVSLPSATPPTVSAPSYGGSTGQFQATVSAVGTATLSTTLPAGKHWALAWTTTINSIVFTVHEIFRVVTTGDAEFGDARYCTAAEVAVFLGVKGGTFTTSTTPSFATVDLLIQNSMSEIDWYTRHAWRTVTSPVEEYDYYGYGFAYGTGFGSGYSGSFAGGSGSTPGFLRYDHSDRGRIYLRHRNIQELLVFEVWDGSTYVDWLSTKTEGRGSDYTLFKEMGVIMFGDEYPFRRGKSVRVKYTYGDQEVPGDISQACIMIVAARLLAQDDRSVLIPEGTSNIPIQTKAQSFYQEAYRILARRKEMVWHTG